MNKQEEINMLQRFIGDARQSEAGYLYDALVSLSVPFENAIRGDYPGDMAASSMLDNLRDLREQIDEKKAELKAMREECDKLQDTLDEKERNIAFAQKRFGIVKEAICDLDNYVRNR